MEKRDTIVKVIFSRYTDEFERQVTEFYDSIGDDYIVEWSLKETNVISDMCALFIARRKK